MAKTSCANTHPPSFIGTNIKLSVVTGKNPQIPVVVLTESQSNYIKCFEKRVYFSHYLSKFSYDHF